MPASDDLRSPSLKLPILRALLAQLLMLVLLAALVWLLARTGLRLPLWSLLLAQGLGAALLGRWLKLPWRWAPINGAFVPLLVLGQQWALPAWLPLLAFGLLALLSGNALIERVPLYLTGRPTRQALAALLAERGPRFRFVDLGCGLGSALLPLARAFPQAQFLGVETAPLSFLIAWLRSLPLRNCRVRLRSLWRQPLDATDVVYCFLSPAPMPRLWAQARGQLPAGSWLISNSFEVPGVAPQRVIEVGDWRGSRLLCWEMPAADASSERAG